MQEYGEPQAAGVGYQAGDSKGQEMSETRTQKQQDSLQLWLRWTANELNDKGIDLKIVIQKLESRGIDIPCTEGALKELVWKPIQKAMIGQESTTQAGTTDYNAEYMGLCKWFAQEFEVTLPAWPDRFHGGEGDG